MYYEGFEILSDVIVLIKENIGWTIFIVFAIAFIIKMFTLAFWTSMVTDLVTNKLEKEYSKKLDEIIKRLEPKDKKPAVPINVDAYMNDKIKL